MFQLFLQAWHKNLKKVGATFPSFNWCPSLASIATDNRKQFQSVKYSPNNQIGLSLFLEFNWSWWEKSLRLSKIKQKGWHCPFEPCSALDVKEYISNVVGYSLACLSSCTGVESVVFVSHLGYPGWKASIFIYVLWTH